MHQRVTIVCKKRFLDRLISSSTVPADFAILCLVMDLVIRQPSTPTASMLSQAYGSVKSLIGLLEASEYLTLEVVQCKILCATYELGHGLLAAASMSVAACARVARFIGLQPRRQGGTSVYLNALEDEERSRAWWALANLDRFIGMCHKEPHLCTQDAAMNDSLPTDDDSWLQDNVTITMPTNATIATAHDITLGQFARESQVSHLIGRVIRHVFDPTPDATFQAQQYSQLERALVALMPHLINEDREFGKYCTALGMCSSALFVLYEHSQPASVGITNDEGSLYLMEPLSTQIVQLSSALFGTGEDTNYGTFSPYVPLSLYQAAVVQLRLWKKTGEEHYLQGLSSLKGTLGYFGRRWTIAGK
ncbi:hypothetical protein Q7P36_010808 [Cladosporium allicinum]